jgi:hypothetical protein
MRKRQAHRHSRRDYRGGHLAGNASVNLLSRITEKNIHPEVNFGELVGDEIL